MNPETVIDQIERIEIQGATAVARAGIELLQEMDSNGASTEKLTDTADRLKAARPTEPLLFNAIDTALADDDYAAVLDHIDTAQDQIQTHGKDLVEDGSTVFTHCHSSTVTGILKAAHETTAFSVHNTETRPLYQGRETAEELAEAGIPVKHFVDSGGRIALKDSDVMLIGADAVTANGTVVNKIGSELFAETANRYDIPVYVCADAWKFDARSRFGYHEKLERRIASEVWDNAPENVEVVNYAFERVAPDVIDGIVSELGVHSPDAFLDAVRSAYPEIMSS